MSQEKGSRKKRFSKVYAVPQFQPDDLVKVDGYGETVFRVDGYTLEGYRGPDVSTDHIVYDMTGVITGEWIVADQEELALVCKAKDADEYVENKLDAESQQQTFITISVDLADFFEGGGQMANKPAESRHRDKEKAEVKRRKDYRKKVNEMMDKYNHLKSEGKRDEAEAIMKQIKVEGVIFAAGGAPQEVEE